VSKTIAVKPVSGQAGRKIDLATWPTRVPSFYKSKDDYRDLLEAHTRRLSERQTLLYAHDRYSLLLIFQAMDARGKDSVIKHVMSGVNRRAARCTASSTRARGARSRLPLAHHASLPERGRIGIFNRSYYEEVLIVARAHETSCARSGCPKRRSTTAASGRALPLDRRVRGSPVPQRHARGEVLLHVSKEEQRKRFLERLDDPEKTWKFSAADLDERDRWDDVHEGVRGVRRRDDDERSPWYIVPADDKPNARLIVSQAIVEALDALDMRFPRPAPRSGESWRPFDASWFVRKERPADESCSADNLDRGEIS
jgi:polyphosphate kinase 2 (PPK2 family)